MSKGISLDVVSAKDAGAGFVASLGAITLPPGSAALPSRYFKAHVGGKFKLWDMSWIGFSISYVDHITKRR